MLDTQIKLYTIEEFWEVIQSSDDYKLAELKHGEILIAGGSGILAALIAAYLVRVIGNFVADHELGYVTGADGHFILSENPAIARIPDVAFVRKERMPKPIPQTFLKLAPDLAVEVISPNDKAHEIRERIEDYLHYGVPLIWVIYPTSQRVDVYRSQNKSQVEVLDINGVLQGETILPEFKLPIRDIFEAVE